MNRDESTSHPLDTHAPVLSKSQKAVLWRKIEAALPDAAVPSPYLFSFVTVRPMAPIALVVALLLGVGGTAAASEQARPGDLLFPVDRALEDVRLALARNDNTRAELQIKFAEERLAELRSILAEADDDFDRNSESETSSNPTDDSVSEDSNFNFEAEADVFTDTTIVKVEINDRKTTFETDADTRAEVIDVIVNRFDIDRATVEAVLDFEIEDRASRIKERVVESSDVRVSTSLDLLDELLSQLSEKDRDRILAATIDQFGTEHNEPRSNRSGEKNDDSEQRIEIRDGENRIRIREKDGESKVEVKGDVSSFSLKNLLDFIADDSDDDRGDSDDSRSSSSFEAEADVFTDTTIVKVEINDRKTTFETDADTRAEVIDVIVNRFDIDRATVEAVLDFEIEDRASRVDDSDSNQSDGDREDSDDDSSDDDDFDDSDHRVRIEVRVEDGRAEVRMEYDGKRDEFETSYISKTALIATLSVRSGLSTGVVSENLDLEIKD